MLTIHHLAESQSERIVWLCEELGLDYEFRRYERDPDTKLAPREYRNLHPAGTAPVVTDQDQAMAESGAIMEYLIARYGDGKLAPDPDSHDFSRYKFWMHYANGSFTAAGLTLLVANMLGRNKSNETVEGLLDRYSRGFDLVEDQLGRTDYLAGERFTPADIIMLYPLSNLRKGLDVSLDKYPNLARYLIRLSERPAYQRMVKTIAPDPDPIHT
ncbi:glutathione S-transferase family protein [Palleronia caenipelagi]|uniref:glutathione transferase n=1 Tax=Palleronia caenipelagi TaxID=2489174 RepID=A0A547PHZ0_9RHOB|nr:glutathione S-transferase family protein [Palleronia caenipelagi]TRD13664.1 glutathione S-transferase family protein [Palleronia caenipelagi]